MSKQADQKTN